MCGCDVSESEVQSSGELDNVVQIREVFAMDTYMSLKAYGADADTALGEAEQRILQLESLLSVNNENSDVYKVNHAYGKAVSVSSDTLELINAAVEYGSKTSGALDITLYPILKLWGFTSDTKQVANAQDIEKALCLVDYKQIFVDGESVILPENAEIDFGALAKGYTGDCVIDILKENNVKSAIINLGGNVQTLGNKPDGLKWRVAVQDPDNTSQHICVLEISDLAVITSGSYERYFVGEDGKRYWHILDAKDGYPADNGLVSVTVVGTSGLKCDALSTALFVMGTEKAIEYWRSDGGFQMILITDDGKIYYTGGLENAIEFSSGIEYEIAVIE